MEHAFLSLWHHQDTELLSGMNEEMTFFRGIETSRLLGTSGHYPAVFVPIHRFLDV